MMTILNNDGKTSLSRPPDLEGTEEIHPCVFVDSWPDCGHKRGGGAKREVAAQQERRRHDKRGTGATREVTMQQPTAGAREAQ